MNIKKVMEFLKVAGSGALHRFWLHWELDHYCFGYSRREGKPLTFLFALHARIDCDFLLFNSLLHLSLIFQPINRIENSMKE